MSAPSRTFDEIYLHINWHCLRDMPLIIDHLELPLYEFVREYCHKNRGIQCLGIGGTPTHIQLVVRVAPSLCPSEFIGKVKGASSHEMNVRTRRIAIQWQRGYGVVSFAKKNLAAVLRYVENQKLHHQQGTTNPVLENAGDVSEEEVPGEHS